MAQWDARDPRWVVEDLKGEGQNVGQWHWCVVGGGGGRASFSVFRALRQLKAGVVGRPNQRVKATDSLF